MQNPAKHVSVYGLPIANGTLPECLSELISKSASRRMLVFTPNLEMLLAAKRDRNLRSLLSRGDLLLPDGIGTCLLSRFRICRRIPGIEMGEALLSAAERNGLRVFLLGGKDGVALRAAESLKREHPHLTVAGTHHGYFEGKNEEAALLRTICAARPQILIVCLGFPKQEAFLLQYKNAIPTLRIGIALGGALDVFAGDVKRAPKLFRLCGTEWLWRIANDPKRGIRLLRRILGLPLAET